MGRTGKETLSSINPGDGGPNEQREEFIRPSFRFWILNNVDWQVISDLTVMQA